MENIKKLISSGKFDIAILTNVNSIWLSLVPSMLLLLCGLGLSIEAYAQVKYAIEISEWAILGEEDDDSAV